MRAVGVRELKSQLSQYLRFVKSGETILVTEHHRVIAEICLPQGSEKNQKDLIEAYLLDGELKGKWVRAKRNSSLVETSPSSSKIDWKQELTNLREDRF